MDLKQIKQNRAVTAIDKLIIGTGVSGLFTGIEFLKKDFSDFLILEKNDRPGGLCRSFKLGELYYDIGAHALHKKALDLSEKLKAIIDENKLYCQKRKAKVFIFKKLIPHPFQLHLFYAPLNVKMKCLLSYLAPRKNNNDNLHNWLIKEFGRKVCEYFLFPYNEKVWKTDLKNTSTNWVSRVSSGRLRFLQGLFFKGNQTYGSNGCVCYPTEGGFESLFYDSIEKLQDKIVLDIEITSIDLVNKTALAKDGRVYKYNHLISTIPLDVLFDSLVKPTDQKIIGLIGSLEKVSTCLATFLITKNTSDLQRVYIPDKKYLAQRVIINSNSSPSLSKSDNSIVSLEISYKHRHELPPEDSILDNCKKLLKNLNFIVSDIDIKQFKIDYFTHMYPTQTVGIESLIKEVQDHLKKHDCHTIGRFGSWNYANIDGIIDEVTTLTNKIF